MKEDEGTRGIFESCSVWDPNRHNSIGIVKVHDGMQNTHPPYKGIVDV